MTISSERAWRALRLLMWGAAALMLLFPFLTGAPWTASDYVVMAALLGIAGGTVELAIRASGDAAYRLAVVVAAGTGFLLVWVNLAVGIIGSEDNPVNLFYFAVVGTVVLGAVVVAGGSAGMARTMFVAAFAQLLVTFGALLWGWGRWEAPGAAGIVALNGFFATLWLLSGALFRRSAGRVRGSQGTGA